MSAIFFPVEIVQTTEFVIQVRISNEIFINNAHNTQPSSLTWLSSSLTFAFFLNISINFYDELVLHSSQLL